MSRKQDRYSRSPKKITVGGRQVMVSADSDLDPEIIELMVDHQVALSERLGEDHSIGWTPQNGAVRAAFRAKGLIN